MKKLLSFRSIPFFLLCLALSSCKKDKPVDEYIIGIWDVQSITRIAYKNDVISSSSTVYNSEFQMSIQFAEEGTGIVSENGTVTGIFAWTINGNILSLDYTTEILEWTVTIDDDILTLSYEESETIDNVTYRYEYFYSAEKED